MLDADELECLSMEQHITRVKYEGKELDGKVKKQDRKAKYSERAIEDLKYYLQQVKEA